MGKIKENLVNNLSEDDFYTLQEMSDEEQRYQEWINSDEYIHFVNEQLAETKPVYSLLEIFWETSLQGKIQTLNSLINAQDNNVIGTTVTSASFAESLGNANEITPFNFITGSSGNINTQLTSAVILQVVDQTGADRTSENLFTLTKWKGFDAESTRTSDFYQYPTPRIYTFGIDVKF